MPGGRRPPLVHGIVRKSWAPRSSMVGPPPTRSTRRRGDGTQRPDGPAWSRHASAKTPARRAGSGWQSPRARRFRADDHHGGIYDLGRSTRAPTWRWRCPRSQTWWKLHGPMCGRSRRPRRRRWSRGTPMPSSRRPGIPRVGHGHIPGAVLVPLASSTWSADPTGRDRRGPHRAHRQAQSSPSAPTGKRPSWRLTLLQKLGYRKVVSMKAWLPWAGPDRLPHRLGRARRARTRRRGGPDLPVDGARVSVVLNSSVVTEPLRHGTLLSHGRSGRPHRQAGDSRMASCATPPRLLHPGWTTAWSPRPEPYRAATHDRAPPSRAERIDEIPEVYGD